MFFDRIHNIEGSDNMYQAGLVLEGGGMKGVYTAGVLDFFLDKKITLANCPDISSPPHNHKDSAHSVSYHNTFSH